MCVFALFIEGGGADCKKSVQQAQKQGVDGFLQALAWRKVGVF
jgi:hypothetical protein